MSSLPKLDDCIIRGSQMSVPAAAVAGVPAALPGVDVQLRQAFQRPQSVASLFPDAPASMDIAVTSPARPEPAPMPSVDAAIPATKPGPPREPVGTQPSASDV